MPGLNNPPIAVHAFGASLPTTAVPPHRVARPVPRFPSNKGKTPLTALLLLTLLVPGCHTRRAESAPATPPLQQELSSEGQKLYNYLSLTDALATNDTESILAALRRILQNDPSLPIFQDAATILLTNRDFPAAIEVLEQGVNMYPGDETLTVLLAGAYGESRKSDSAILLLENYNKKYPNKPGVLTELIRLLLRTGDVKKAEHYLAYLPEGTSPQAMFFRIRVYTAAQNYTAAKSLLTRYLQKYPASIEGYIELGLIAENEKDIPKAIQYYKKAGAIAPDNPEIWLRILSLQLSQGQPQTALATLKPLRLGQEQNTRVLFLFAELGYMEEAEALLQEMVGRGLPADEAALYLSMIRLQGGKKPADGLAPLNSIPKDSPYYEQALDRKIRIYLSLSDYANAAAAAKEARTHFPKNIGFWELESYALAKNGQEEEARSLLAQARKLFPSNMDILFALGTLEDELGDKETAMGIMESIIQKNPRHAKALNYVGYTLADENRDLERALELLTVALQEAPDASYIMDSLAWAQYRLGKFEEAWQTMQRCLEQGVDEATIWEHYGDIARALHKKAEARDGYMEALKRSPSNAADIQKKLDALY